MPSDEEKESMLKRVKVRASQLEQYLIKLERLIQKGGLGGEYDRLWLDKFTIKGQGLDICCGDFLIYGSEGVDIDPKKLGASYSFVEGDELTNHDSNCLDFIVTNSFDVFPNILKVLNEWNRVLVPGGILAFCCRNADFYGGTHGPLENRHRVNCFTKKTIGFYLSRANYKNIKVEEAEGTLRVSAEKT